MSKEDLIIKAIKSVVDGDENTAMEVANSVIAEGINPLEIINEGFGQGMIKVGDLFANEEYSLPEVLFSADTMQKAIDLLTEHIPREAVKETLGTVVIGTVLGDIHDIGKNIVATMLEVYGFTVHDLGRDVPIENFIKKTQEVNADIIAASALMTTTMVSQKHLHEALQEAGIREKVKLMVGGAAVTQEWAEQIGADGYAEEVTKAVELAKEYVS
ncbi:MAG: corrinoid protein [Desulfobacterales bacterium]|nr:corrinoid protein [Deltaproteobacteria bacterium]NNL76771.1 corrinoid protein [Desulfobacterales bacterium]